MGRLVIETWVAAPREVVFDLSRDVGAHARSASFSRERAVSPGRLAGLLEAGDLATFEGRHFGLRQRFTLRIIDMDPPRRYADELIRGLFRGLHHLHEFEAVNEGTLMRDTLEWRPWPVIDFVAILVLRRYVTRKQTALKAMAEYADRNRHSGGAGGQ